MTSRRVIPSPPRSRLPGGGTFLEPRAFVGFAGTSRRRVEIWEVEHLFIGRDRPKHFEHVRDAVMFGAFDKKKDLFIGTLDLRLVPIEPPCASDLPVLGAKPELAYQVAGAALLPEYKNLGVGVALYVAGAAYAWRAGGHAIAADACFDSDTSEDARRVWASSRFREHVVVGESGLTARYRMATGRSSGRCRRTVGLDVASVAMPEKVTEATRKLLREVAAHAGDGVRYWTSDRPLVGHSSKIIQLAYEQDLMRYDGVKPVVTAKGRALIDSAGGRSSGVVYQSLQQVENEVGTMASSIPGPGVLKPAGLSLIDGDRVFYLQKLQGATIVDRAWAVMPASGSVPYGLHKQDAFAERLGRKLFTALIGKRNVHYTVPHLHDHRLYVLLPHHAHVVVPAAK